MRAYEQDLGHFEAGDAVAEPAAGRSWLARALDAVMLWRERARSRHNLLALNDFMLRDIGLDRGVADCEGSKPFWQR